MPSIIGHSLAGIVGANCPLKFTKRLNTKKLIVLSLLTANLPDIDVMFVHLGLDQNGFFGHRNFFHSIFFAVILAPIIGFLSALKEAREVKINLSIYFLIVILSHDLLDGLTESSGVSFFYPFIKTHLSFPITPLLPSGFSINSFTNDGALYRECFVLWVPSLILIAFLKWYRK
jgi:inner membrane protein